MTLESNFNTEIDAFVMSDERREEPKVLATANVSAIKGKDSSPYGLGMTNFPPKPGEPQKVLCHVVETTHWVEDIACYVEDVTR